MSDALTNVLVVDDDDDARLLMRAALRKAGFEVTLASGGRAALQQFREGRFHLVMLDVDMPDLSGYEVCKALRAEAGELLPIVMVTGMDDTASVDRAYDSGATDFIAKPVNWALVGHRVRYLLRSYGTMLALRAAEEHISRLAYVDSLTGLPNRRSFEERVRRSIQRAESTQRKLALLFMDLDGFKDVNDTLGHAAGDVILKAVANRLREGLRPDDVLARGSMSDVDLARLGGDEFTALVVDIAEPKDALEVAHRIGQSMRRPFDLEGRTVGLSASIGVALYPDDSHDGVTLIKYADAAMYHAKNSGGDNARLYSATLAGTRLRRIV